METEIIQTNPPPETIHIPNPNNNEALIQGLEELARFLRHSPDFPTITSHLWASFWFSNKIDLVNATKLLHHTKKEYNGGVFNVVRKFGPGNQVQIRLAIAREHVCEKKVVGVKKVEAYTIAAHEEEVVEWKCSEPLLAAPTETLVIEGNGKQEIR